MDILKDVRGSIKLDKETVFFHNLSQNKEKLEIYKEALEEGKISNFDQTTLARLRKLYYGFYSGLIYMYYEPTSFSNIGNKAELLTYAMEDKKYQLVHGDTDSIRDIHFVMYDVEHLDYNSWFEVEEGHKTWVYDFFSMLKIEKNVYYELEHPEISKVIPKSAFVNHPGRERDDFYTYHDGFDYMLVGLIPQMEKNLDKHPFKDILAPEITRFKKEIHFDDIVLEWNKEKREAKKKS